METVLHVITGLGLGGAESQLFHFVTSDTSRKHHVVSLMHEGVFGPRLKEHDIAVTCLHMPAGKISFAGMRQLYRLVRSMRPDYVQTWMYHADLVGGLMAQLAGARNIFGACTIRMSILPGRPGEPGSLFGFVPLFQALFPGVFSAVHRPV